MTYELHATWIRSRSLASLLGYNDLHPGIKHCE
jgi:hypothetical protein